MCVRSVFGVQKDPPDVRVGPKITLFYLGAHPSLSRMSRADIESDPHPFPFRDLGMAEKTLFPALILYCLLSVCQPPPFSLPKKSVRFYFLLLYERKSFSRICFSIHCFVFSLYSSKLRDAGRVPLFSSTKYQVSICKSFAFSHQ